jgi:hypothetical protein
VAKASAEGGATHYLAEGEPVPDDLSPEVRLVGPGAPAEAEEEEAAEGPFPDSTPEPSSPGSSAPGDDDGPAGYDGLLLTELAELCRERGLPVYGTKADLTARLTGYDEEHPEKP